MISRRTRRKRRRLADHGRSGGADGPATPVPGDYAAPHVGDRTDTSPYPTDNPVIGVSVGTYIRHMGVLIDHLEGQR